MNRLLKILFIIIILICNSYFVYADDIDEDETDYITIEEVNEVSNIIEIEPVTNSRKCIVYDRDTNMVLYGKNENVKCPMASTTNLIAT